MATPVKFSPPVSNCAGISLFSTSRKHLRKGPKEKKNDGRWLLLWRLADVWRRECGAMADKQVWAGIIKRAPQILRGRRNELTILPGTRSNARNMKITKVVFTLI